MASETADFPPVELCGECFRAEENCALLGASDVVLHQFRTDLGNPLKVPSPKSFLNISRQQ
jgi:hypothetical protein